MLRPVVTVENNMPGQLSRGLQAVERKVTMAVRAAGQELKANWRGQVVAAGLGQRLANTIKEMTHPDTTTSLDAASVVYAGEGKIIAAHERGAVIRARGGVWLAIPLPAAGGRRRGYGRPSPAEWQFRTGRILRFVPPAGGRRNALLVAEPDQVRLSKAGVALRRKGKRRARAGILTGETPIPIFVLVRQAKLPKRLGLMQAGAVAKGQLAGRLQAALRGRLA